MEQLNSSTRNALGLAGEQVTSQEKPFAIAVKGAKLSKGKKTFASNHHVKAKKEALLIDEVKLSIGCHNVKFDDLLSPPIVTEKKEKSKTLDSDPSTPEVALEIPDFVRMLSLVSTPINSNAFQLDASDKLETITEMDTDDASVPVLEHAARVKPTVIKETKLPADNKLKRPFISYVAVSVKPIVVSHSAPVNILPTQDIVKTLSNQVINVVPIKEMEKLMPVLPAAPMESESFEPLTIGVAEKIELRADNLVLAADLDQISLPTDAAADNLPPLDAKLSEFDKVPQVKEVMVSTKAVSERIEPEAVFKSSVPLSSKEFTSMSQTTSVAAKVQAFDAPVENAPQLLPQVSFDKLAVPVERSRPAEPVVQNSGLQKTNVSDTKRFEKSEPIIGRVQQMLDRPKLLVRAAEVKTEPKTLIVAKEQIRAKAATKLITTPHEPLKSSARLNFSVIKSGEPELVVKNSNKALLKDLKAMASPKHIVPTQVKADVSTALPIKKQIEPIIKASAATTKIALAPPVAKRTKNILSNENPSAVNNFSSVRADNNAMPHKPAVNVSALIGVEVVEVKKHVDLQQIELVLKPEYLGRVIAKLRFSDKQMLVQIQAPTKDIADTLALNEASLKQAIKRANIAQDCEIKLVLVDKNGAASFSNLKPSEAVTASVPTNYAGSGAEAFLGGNPDAPDSEHKKFKKKAKSIEFDVASTSKSSGNGNTVAKAVSSDINHLLII